MSAVQMTKVKMALSTVELAAQTASALEADARRYADRTRELRDEMLHGQELRRAAWIHQTGDEPKQPFALVAA